MRVVGYIRETSPEREPAFAQSERIRRWIGASGHRLIALCQDTRTPGHPVGREGLQSIIGIVSAGQVDAVVVPSLETLSPDKISQEVIMWDLRGYGIALLSTEAADLTALSDPPDDRVRLMVRDVLAKAARFHEILSLPIPEPVAEPPQVIRIDDAPDVVIELIPPPGRKTALPGMVSQLGKAEGSTS